MTEGSESDGNAIDVPSNTITANISKGQLFGPISNPLHWLSYKSTSDAKSTPFAANHLFSRIDIARHSSEQNIKIVCKNGNFYFKALQDINIADTEENERCGAGSKLLAWFGRELEARLPNALSSSLNGSTRYYCPLCNEVFMYSNSAVVHILCVCSKRVRIDSIPVPSNGNDKQINSNSKDMKASVSNGTVSQPKPHISRKRGFDIESLVRDESEEGFREKRNKNNSETNKCAESLCSTDSSAFHRPKSPTIVRRNSSLSLTSAPMDMNPSLMTSAFKKVDHKLSSMTNPYDFSSLYQRVATTSLLPPSTGSVGHPLLSQMPMAAQMPSLPTSLSSSTSKSLVSNTLLPYLPPSLAALTFPTSNWCAKCNATFRMTSDLVYHMRSHHKGAAMVDTMKKKREEKLRCSICNETFRERHHLTRHMTSHQ